MVGSTTDPDGREDTKVSDRRKYKDKRTIRVAVQQKCSEASDHLLWVEEADEMVCTEVLDDQTYLLCHSLAHTKLVSEMAVTARGAQTRNDHGHLLLHSEG